VVDITEISAIVAAAGVLVGVVYYIMDLRHNARAREMEMSRMVTSDFNSEQGTKRYATMMNLEWKDYDDFVEKYSSRSNPEISSKWTSQFMVWDMLGFLIKRKVVKAEELYEFGGWAAILPWEKYKDIIQRYRDVLTGQDFLSNAEFFAQEMLRMKLKRDPSFKDKLETYRKTLKPKYNQN
jgi:hypothetical protein